MILEAAREMFANEGYEAERTTATVRNAFQTYLRRKKVETRYTFLQNTLIYVSKGLVLWLGGREVILGRMSVGDFVAFVTAWEVHQHADVPVADGLACQLLQVDVEI